MLKTKKLIDELFLMPHKRHRLRLKTAQDLLRLTYNALAYLVLLQSPYPLSKIYM